MSTQPTDEEIRELWSQYNPLHGIQSFARAVLEKWGTSSEDAEDAARYRWLALKAYKESAYDRLGLGAYWRIGFHVDDGRLDFSAAIDAARKEGK
jgi:hypothetical protein